MSTHVSAETVTSITAAPEFTAGKAADAPPTVRELIREIRQNLSKIGDGRSQIQLAKLHEIVSNIPAGFQLAPVFYSRASTKDARDQHEGIVRDQQSGIADHSFCSPFLQYLAENHQDELRQLGISNYGISYMMEGVYPLREDGQQYMVNVDHVIEIAGSGLWASRTAPDPLGAPDSAPKLMVNHFSNLILLPEQIHEWKNALNDMQRLSNLSPGDGKWALMLIPTTANGRYSGYVAPPQNASHPLAGLRMCSDDFATRLSQAKWQIMVANDMAADAAFAMTAVSLHPVLGNIVSNYIDPSNTRKGLTPVNDNQARKEFWRALDNAVYRNKDLRRFVRDELVPSMLRAAENLTQAFNVVAETKDTRQGRHLFNSFNRLYKTGEVRTLRDAVSYLPLKETLILQETFRELDEKVSSLKNVFGEVAKKPRGNSHQKAPAPRGKKPKKPKNDNNDVSASHRKKRGPGRWSGRNG